MLFIATKSAVRRVPGLFQAKLRLILPVLILCTVSALHGQQKQETQQQTNEKIQELAAAERTKPHDAPVGTGDLLHIEVFDVPELSRDVRVGDAGDISFPLIPSKITAAGLTPFQLEQKMEQLLIENGLVTHPQVSVFVKEQNSQPVSVVGAVMKPMVYQLIRPTTLLELLADAGGIADDAGGVVIVTRNPNPVVPPVASTAAVPAPNSMPAGTRARAMPRRKVRWNNLRKSSRFGCGICWNPGIRRITFGFMPAMWCPCRARASSMSPAREFRNRAAMYCKVTESRSRRSKRWRWRTD